MSKRRKTNTNVNQENVNEKEETTMKKEETEVKDTKNIQELSDKDLGVKTEENEEVNDEYAVDEDGNKIKIVYIEVEKEGKLKKFFKKHKKVIIGTGIGIITTAAGAVGAAIASGIANRTPIDIPEDADKKDFEDEDTYNKVIDSVNDIFDQNDILDEVNVENF